MSLFTGNPTILSPDDVRNICNDVQNGIPYSAIMKKYKIGGSRITTLLKKNNCSSILRGSGKKQLLQSYAQSSQQSQSQSQSSQSSQSQQNTQNDVLHDILQSVEQMKQSSLQRRRH